MLIIVAIANSIKKKNEIKNPEYKYFIKGLLLKIVASVSFCLVYIFYYNGGDTIEYYIGSLSIANLLFEKPNVAFSILLGDLSQENFTRFTITSGWPTWYIWKDPNTFSVCRYTTPFIILGSKSFIVTSMLLATFCYIGIWRLYRLLVMFYPTMAKPLATCILFVPSVVFWGSGIMKDTYTFSATCWYVVSFYGLLIQKKRITFNICGIIVSVFFMVTIKPYILYSLIPGCLIWLSFNRINAIKSSFLRFIITPAIVSLATIITLFILNQMSDVFGKFSMDQAVAQAQIIQQDLKREEAYGSNSFDIGDYDGTLSDMLQLSPMAINAALFRPYIFEGSGAALFVSAVENTIILLFSILTVINIGVFRTFRYIKKDPYLIFALIFSLIFAFMVGMSTANFGALVRYKIPCIPFYLSILFICRMYHKKDVINSIKKR